MGASESTISGPSKSDELDWLPLPLRLGSFPGADPTCSMCARTPDETCPKRQSGAAGAAPDTPRRGATGTPHGTLSTDSTRLAVHKPYTPVGSFGHDGAAKIVQSGPAFRRADDTPGGSCSIFTQSLGLEPFGDGAGAH
jgi:hypothetical protein